MYTAPKGSFMGIKMRSDCAKSFSAEREPHRFASDFYLN
jgi:hypothetical protein